MNWRFNINRRRVPKPAIIGPHASVNPNFDNTQLAQFRTKVLVWTGFILVLLAFGLLTYGPWFKIQDIVITGTRRIDPQSIERVSWKFINGQRWLILPNRTSWILSTSGLSNYLTKTIKRTIAVDTVTVTKNSLHQLTVAVAERTPLVNWVSRGSNFLVDRQGIVMESLTDPVPELPLVTDENLRLTAVNASMVKPEVIEAIVNLADLLHRANIPVATYYIPVPTCLSEIVPAVITNTNSNTNSSLNVNSRVQINQNKNSNQAAPVNAAKPCDLPGLMFSSQEIHLQLVDGPRVLFDRHSNLTQSVDALKRVLTQTYDHPLTSIDVRFSERVYIK